MATTQDLSISISQGELGNVHRTYGLGEDNKTAKDALVATLNGNGGNVPTTETTIDIAGITYTVKYKTIAYLMKVSNN